VINKRGDAIDLTGEFLEKYPLGKQCRKKRMPIYELEGTIPK
jgi:hypothetical protein